MKCCILYVIVLYRLELSVHDEVSQQIKSSNSSSHSFFNTRKFECYIFIMHINVQMVALKHDKNIQIIEQTSFHLSQSMISFFSNDDKFTLSCIYDTQISNMDSRRWWEYEQLVIVYYLLMIELAYTQEHFVHHKWMNNSINFFPKNSVRFGNLSISFSTCFSSFYNQLSFIHYLIEVRRTTIKTWNAALWHLFFQCVLLFSTYVTQLAFTT
jgi:hypothetical protein